MILSETSKVDDTNHQKSPLFASYTFILWVYLYKQEDNFIDWMEEEKHGEIRPEVSLSLGFSVDWTFGSELDKQESVSWTSRP